MHICTSACVRQSPNRSPLEPVMVQKSHAFPMLTHTKQWVPPRSLPLSFSPCHVLFPSPFHSLPPVATAAIITIITPLCLQLIFSLTSSLEEDNYQMGTPCFNSDFEVNDTLTFCSSFMLSAVKLANVPEPPSHLTPLLWPPMHTSVHSEIALGVITVIPHCLKSWQDTLCVLRLGTLCPCSARC